jgi:predicted AAA+ superfamily ATPase
LWDWINIGEEGNRMENLVASHLLKTVHFWTDCGLGLYDLWFIIDIINFKRIMKERNLHADSKA